MADVTLKGLLGEFRNYLRDASPGGLLNPEITPERAKNALEYVSMTPTPFGDAASGLLAGNYLMKGQFGNAGLEAVGLLPFVPGITKAFKKVPIREGEALVGGNGDNLLVYLDEINSKQMRDRAGKEVLKKRIGNIDVTKSQYGGGRYIYRDNNGDIVSALQYVRGNEIPPTISNIYTRPDKRNQGIASMLVDAAKNDMPKLQVDNHFTEEGAKFFGYK